MVVSAIAFTENMGLAVVCPITSPVRPFPTSAMLPAGLPVAGKSWSAISAASIRRPVRSAMPTPPFRVRPRSSSAQSSTA
ncbi:MAG: hypothetical protein ACREDY_11770 [Bradyrhizobium sp.]